MHRIYTLGVQPGASLAECKSAYKALSKIYHLDKPGGSDEAQKAITEALQTLQRRERQVE